MDLFDMSASALEKLIHQRSANSNRNHMMAHVTSPYHEHITLSQNRKPTKENISVTRESVQLCRTKGTNKYFPHSILYCNSYWSGQRWI